MTDMAKEAFSIICINMDFVLKKHWISATQATESEFRLWEKEKRITLKVLKWWV